jgi:SAM-dependent methyltransferase
MTESPDYVFQNRQAEDDRLFDQGRIFDRFTRPVLVEAGLSEGMRVLDLGSGAGNVAFLAAELVGPEGHVVGLERDAEAVELARRRASSLGVNNVELRVGDVQSLEGVEDGFDAVIGRLILMYLAEPVGALRAAAARTRPGGVIYMQEADLSYLWASPQTPLWVQVRGWFLDTLAKAGVEPSMGLRMFSNFLAAGLPEPQLRLEANVQGGTQASAPVYAWANAVRGIVPLMERLGVATSAQVDTATLGQRLLAELTADHGMAIGPPMVSAWAIVPSH